MVGYFVFPGKSLASLGLAGFTKLPWSIFSSFWLGASLARKKKITRFEFN